MLNSVNNAVCLPAPDIEALIQGRTIVATPRLSIRQGRQFSLYPLQIPATNLEENYRQSFLPSAKMSLATTNSEGVKIQVWARCELCQIINSAEELEKISPSTVWPTEALEKKLTGVTPIFLAYLRVYHLPQALEIPADPDAPEKLGKFIGLPEPITVTKNKPVLSDRLFTERRQQLENRLPPQFLELENLESNLWQLSKTNPAAATFQQEIRNFLGWSELELDDRESEPWIKEITPVGNSGDGDKFEKLVRKSFLKLGFNNTRSDPKVSLDPEATGGAGGIDFFCDKPYEVVGECKATGSGKVPDGALAQLMKLALKYLSREEYDRCVKILAAAGKLTSDAAKTAKGNEMNVISPETLQRLVELKANYPGSIDLWQLKTCLEKQPFGGGSDSKVNSYIDAIEQELQLRSLIIKLVENADEEVNVGYLRGFYNASNPPRSLSERELHELLLELSSPLTGYLGREKANNWKEDKFYFLRSLNT